MSNSIKEYPISFASLIIFSISSSPICFPLNLGFDLEEDLIELVTQREDIKDRIENTKYKKMTFSKDEEANSYILNLEDCQISFDIIEGEDEQGPWFEIECNIIFF